MVMLKDLTNPLILTSFIFIIGGLGVCLPKKTGITMLMGLELMLLASIIILLLFQCCSMIY